MCAFTVVIVCIYSEFAFTVNARIYTVQKTFSHLGNSGLWLEDFFEILQESYLPW